MIRYDINRTQDNQSITVDKFSLNKTLNKRISNVSEYNEIVSRFIRQDFNVAISGNTLVLQNNSTVFNIIDYKSYYYNDYLNELRKAIEKKVDLVRLELEGRLKIKKEAEVTSKKGIFSRFKKAGTTIAATVSAVSIALSLYATAIETKNINQSLAKETNTTIKTSTTSIYKEYKQSTPQLELKSEKNIVSKAISPSNEQDIPIDETISSAVPVIEEIPNKSAKEIYIEECEKYLTVTSDYYHFDSEKVKEFVRTITNNYEIPFSEILDTECNIDTPESVSIVICSKLYANRFKKLGFPVSDFTINNDIDTLDKSLILKNGLSFTEFYGYIADVLGVDKYHTLAICLLESGRLTSSLTFSRNNFGGIGGSGHYSTFPTSEAGIIAHIRILKEYESKNFQSLEELSAYYVNGKLIKDMSEKNKSKYIAYSWVKNVTSLTKEVISKEESLFTSPENAQEAIYGPLIESPDLQDTIQEDNKLIAVKYLKK